MRILLIEDDQRIANFVRKGLIEVGHSVDVAADGNEGGALSLSTSYDLVILDIGLPGMDGFEVLDYVRKHGGTMPVLMLTARDEVEDKVRALDGGADDYLTKPFSFAELEARVRALLRRGTNEVTATLTVENVILDPVKRSVRRNDQAVELTPKEFAVLEYFMRSPGRVLTRTMIIEHVWQYQFDTDTNLVDVYVNRLRKKLSDSDGQLLQTVRGVGYSMRPRE